MRRLHGRDRQALLPAFPNDLLSKICDRARYLGLPVHVSREQLDWAWHLYFGTGRRLADQLEPDKRLTRRLSVGEPYK